MKRALSACLAVLCASVVWTAPDSRAASAELKYVAVVTRHGVRAPTWKAEELNRYSAEPWPDFGVPRGYLTPRGRTLMTLMGAYYADWLADERLLRRTGCEDAGRVYIWADVDQRTIETGRALGESLLPGCGVAVHSLPAGTADDPLFDPIGAGAVAPDFTSAARVVRDRVGEPPAYINRYRQEFALLHRVLTGGARAKEEPFKAPSKIGVEADRRGIELIGPLSTASTFSELFLLEYGNGFMGKDLGWGRLSRADLTRLLELHTAYADLMRRTPALARARGSNLLSRVLRSLEQAAAGRPVPGALGQPGDIALFVSGHDTNLSNLSGMLGLSWKLPDYPADDTPPGGALIFSLWRDGTGNGEYFVRTRYVAQTFDQMRDAAVLSVRHPPAGQDLTLPGCRASMTGSGCPWTAFASAVRTAIDPAFTR